LARFWMLGVHSSSLNTKQFGACVACMTRSAAALPVADLAKMMNGCKAVRYCSFAML
jgi:hypothetical protein